MRQTDSKVELAFVCFHEGVEVTRLVTEHRAAGTVTGLSLVLAPASINSAAATMLPDARPCAEPVRAASRRAARQRRVACVRWAINIALCEGESRPAPGLLITLCSIRH